jgi:essential nuclear protein 1
LILTSPHQWSPNATYEATRIFASVLNVKMAQRFYSVILLDNVRNNIAKYKKLNCHLYRAVKKAMFKVAAFFKGFLLPLAEDATAREAVIIGSILAKMSINNLDAAATLMKLLMMPYGVGTGFFIKTLIAKKYALPTQVLNALVQFFLKFAENQEAPEEDSEDDEGMNEDSQADEEDEEPKEDDGLMGGDKQLPVMWH